MKFVHIADMHFDGIFNNISNKENLGELRRLDQRKIFKKIIKIFLKKLYSKRINKHLDHFNSEIN